jgi:hypothetical protein
MKKITVYLFSLIVLAISMIYLIAYVKQSRISTDYGFKLNDYRASRDLYLLNEAHKVEEESWFTLWPSRTLDMGKLILSNTTIPLRINYEFDRSISNAHHVSKSVEVWTELLFWNNSYRGETDVFQKVVSEDTIIQLYLKYTPEYKEYFYANIDTLYPNEPTELVCGTIDVSELSHGKLIGNINKDEADKILISWGLKNK